MEFKKYKVEWILLLIGFLGSLFSVFFDIASESNTTWFARSGSLLVLFAVIVEYRLTQFIFRDIRNANISNAIKNNSAFQDNKLLQVLTDKNPTLPKSRAYLTRISHIFIILGTSIWGYGDLLVK